MLTFTDEARSRIRSFAEFTDNPTLRITVHGSPLVPQYELALVDDEPSENDVVVEQDGFRVIMEESSAPRLDGASVDYIRTVQGEGFQVTNPNARTLGSETPKGPLAERVTQVLEENVNPSIAAHGGHIGLVDIDEEAIVYLEMSGGCQGCGMAKVTLKQGVERMLSQLVPEIRGIVDVTDHAAGSNPFYQAAK